MAERRGEWPTWIVATGCGVAFVCGLFVAWAVFSQPARAEVDQPKAVNAKSATTSPNSASEVARDEDKPTPHAAVSRPWWLFAIERSDDPPALNCKAYVKIVFPAPADEAALRECLANVVQEFAPHDEPSHERQLYFTIRASADEWRKQTKNPTGNWLADATFDLKKGVKLMSLDQSNDVSLKIENAKR